MTALTPSPEVLAARQHLLDLAFSTPSDKGFLFAEGVQAWYNDWTSTLDLLWTLACEQGPGSH